MFVFGLLLDFKKEVNQYKNQGEDHEGRRQQFPSIIQTMIIDFRKNIRVKRSLLKKATAQNGHCSAEQLFLAYWTFIGKYM